MQVFKWGESLAVCLPSAVVQALDLREGDCLEFTKEQAGSARFFAHKTLDDEQLLESLRAFRGRLPAGWRMDRDEADERA